MFNLKGVVEFYLSVLCYNHRLQRYNICKNIWHAHQRNTPHSKADQARGKYKSWLASKWCLFCYDKNTQLVGERLKQHRSRNPSKQI